MPRAAASPLRLALVMGMVSCSFLVYEITMMRLLSVVLFYHFVFLCISLAMLGVSAPGVWLSVRPGSDRTLPRALVAAAVLLPLSVASITKLGAVVPKAGNLTPELGNLAHGGLFLVVASVGIPLIVLGTAICLILMAAEGPQIGAVYGADLLGATLGAAMVVPLMTFVPTPLLAALTGLLPLSAAWLLGRPSRRLLLVVGAALAVTAAWGEPYRLRYGKRHLEVPGASRGRGLSGAPVYEKWTPTARITVFDDVFWKADPGAAFGWGLGTAYQPADLEQLWVELDGLAGTPITRLDRPVKELTHLLFDVTSAGYQLAPRESVCIIGPGGGRDILTALAAGATRVDAVELNAGLIDTVSGRFGAYTGDVYHMPGVRAVNDEGRSFLTRTPARYDLIQISLIDTWATTAAGAYALSENYLYTVEAFQLYWRRLREGGLLTVSRWMLGPHQLEAARASLLAKEALSREGVAEPARHLAVVQGSSIASLLVSKVPFDAARLATLDEVCAARGFVRHWPPAPVEGLSVVQEVLGRGPEGMARLGFDLSPPTDDRPFFFQPLSPFRSVSAEAVSKVAFNQHSVILLRTLMGVVSLVAVALCFGPFLMPRARRPAGALVRSTGYFASIGLGFMLVETPWIQRFVLYLGHPSYATTVVLALMLLGASAGAATAGRTDVSRTVGLLPLLPVVLLVLNGVLAPLFRATLGWGFPLRVLASGVVIAPAGFLMGFAFPLGVLRFGDAGKPWYWAVNGAASVVASVTSLALAMEIGFVQVGLLGVACYLAAALFARRA